MITTPTFFKISQGGNLGVVTENTIQAFDLAIKHGSHILEVDVHVCNSGEVIVMHDEKVDRTTNGSGYISDLDFAAICKLTTDNGEKVPLLSDVITFVNRRTPIFIHIKNAATTFPVVKVIESFLSKGWEIEDFIGISFDTDILQVFSKALPDAKVEIMLDNKTRNLSKIVGGLNVFSINVNLKSLTNELIEQAHALGVYVFVWTINSKSICSNIKKSGADGIFTTHTNIINIDDM